MTMEENKAEYLERMDLPQTINKTNFFVKHYIMLDYCEEHLNDSLLFNLSKLWAAIITTSISPIYPQHTP